MSIVTWMGATVIAYLAELDDWWERGTKACACVHCHTACRRHSQRFRAAWTSFCLRSEERIPVLRLYCPHCRATYTLLPDFLAPRRRYQTPIREAVLAGTSPAPPCDARTVQRWITAFRARITAGLAALISQRQRLLPVGRQERACLTLGPASWRTLRQVRDGLARQATLPPASCLIGWANQTLCLVGAAL